MDILKGKEVCAICSRFFSWDSADCPCSEIIFEYDGICGVTGNPVTEDDTCEECVITI